MRHKFLIFTEPKNEERILEKPTDIDETYIPECHKGLVDADIIGDTVIIHKKRRERPRGISDEKTCLNTAIEHGGFSYIKAENNGKPTIADLNKICAHVNPGTYVWTDCMNGYDAVLASHQCPHKEIKSGTAYDQVNHLNTVNSLHSQIREILRRFRGVSSIYINQYASLFSLRREFIGCDLQEMALEVIKWLRSRCQNVTYAGIKDHIYADPFVLKCREGLLSALEIRKMQENGYKIIHSA